MNRILVVIMLLTVLSCSRKGMSEKSDTITSLKNSYNSSIYNADSTGIIFYSLDSIMARTSYQFGVFNVAMDSIIYQGKIDNGRLEWQGVEYVRCSERTGVNTIENSSRNYYINLNTGEITRTVKKKS